MMWVDMVIIRECEIGSKAAFEKALSELYVYYSANRSETRADHLLRAIRAYVDQKRDTNSDG